MERKIASRRLTKFKRKYGDAEMHLQDVMRKPTLTSRDKDILLSVYYHRCLTREQVEEMHCKYKSTGEVNSQSDVIARRRLRNLFDSQLIDRFFVDVGEGQGSSQQHVILDSLGARVVAGLLNLPVEELAWRYEMNDVRLPYLSHMVSVNDFYLHLLRHARNHGHEVTGFHTEHHVRHEFTYWNHRMVVNPDAYGQYWKGNEGVHFFLEWDNGTMTPATFQKKHQRYSAFYDSGEFEPIYGEFPLILTVAPDMNRAQALRKCIYGVDDTDMRWLFTSEDRLRENPLGTIWYGNAEKPASLFD